jgi:hypothetical protein
MCSPQEKGENILRQDMVLFPEKPAKKTHVVLAAWLLKETIGLKRHGRIATSETGISSKYKY